MNTFTIREAILAKLQQLLAPVVNGGVYRSREAAIDRKEGVGIVIRPADESPEFKADIFAMRDFVVELEIIARGQIPDQVADPFVGAAHAAIMADPTLGGLVARTIEEATKWDFEQADMNAVSVTIRYKLRYATPANSLTRSL